MVEFERVNAVWEIFLIDKYKIHFFKGQNHIDKIFFTFRKKKEKKTRKSCEKRLIPFSRNILF